MYDCKMCCCCCKNIGRLVIGAIAAQDDADKSGTPTHPILDELAAFPYDIHDDGSCTKLDKEGGYCKVYASRPMVCNIDQMYDRYWSQVMDRETWYKESYKSCLKLNEAKKDGLNK